jgi:hypothetical protein
MAFPYPIRRIYGDNLLIPDWLLAIPAAAALSGALAGVLVEGPGPSTGPRIDVNDLKVRGVYRSNHAGR